jgi:hypothetical protein
MKELEKKDSGNTSGDGGGGGDNGDTSEAPKKVKRWGGGLPFFSLLFIFYYKIHMRER